MLRLIICGSPRSDGRSAALSNTIFEGCIAEFPKDEITLVPISAIDVKGCTGCGGCNGAESSNGAEVARGAESTDGAETPNSAKSTDSTVVITPANRCVQDDDMEYVYDCLAKADEVILVSPIYFSGAPAQLKAMLDRLQPYYAETAAEREKAKAEGKPFKTATKPITLHIVGEGKSPNGYDALVGEVSSAFAVAGFRLDVIVDWVGKISADGEITGEADMFALTDDEETGETSANLDAEKNADVNANYNAGGNSTE